MKVKMIKSYNKYSLTSNTNQSIKVITKLPTSEQSNKGKVKTHKYINRPFIHPGELKFIPSILSGFSFISCKQNLLSIFCQLHFHWLISSSARCKFGSSSTSFITNVKNMFIIMLIPFLLTSVQSLWIF